DSNGKVVTRYESTDRPAPPDPNLNIPTYWIRPHQPLEAGAGVHRFIWDLHGARTGREGGRGGYPVSALYSDTPGAPGPWVAAGTYTVKLTVDGQSYTQTLTIRPDPR